MNDGKVKLRCGMFLRPEMRAIFDYAGMEWVEHKGWLESHFVATGTSEQARIVMAALQRMKEGRG